MNKKGALKPVISILYDFDKTLCTKDMQEYGFIPRLGMTAEEFWSETGKLAAREKMDKILSYMYMMIRKSREKSVPIRRETFVELGRNIVFFKGVESWFGRIGDYGSAQGVEVEHYIISSGIKEIIEGCSIPKAFKQIYACEFHYDENGVADWPKSVVNYTTKTQHLFRVNKGVLDVADDDSLNSYVAEDDRRVPFRNMIYIGDGWTDVPCMKLVKVNGGQSIAVYSGKDKATVDSLIKDGRVNYIAKADYTENSELDAIVKDIIVKMAIDNKLINLNKRLRS